VGTLPTRKSRRGRSPWADGFEKDLAYGFSERGWTHREIFDWLNEMRQVLGKPPLEDVIGASSPYYRAVRDRIDAGRARSEAASARYKKLLKKDLAVAKRLAALITRNAFLTRSGQSGEVSRILRTRRGGKGPARTQKRRTH